MPKQRISKEMVVAAAFEIARNSGMEQVMVKSIADNIGCSVQPIYSYCKNMEGLRHDVMEFTKDFVREYVATHIDENDLFRSIGKVHIQLAIEEPHIFKMFITQQRKGISSLNDLYQSENGSHIAQGIAYKLNISISKAKRLFLNMLVYTLGMGTILSTTTPGIPAEEILAYQELAYEAFLKQAVSNLQVNHDGK